MNRAVHIDHGDHGAAADPHLGPVEARPNHLTRVTRREVLGGAGKVARRVAGRDALDVVTGEDATVIKRSALVRPGRVVGDARRDLVRDTRRDHERTQEHNHGGGRDTRDDHGPGVVGVRALRGVVRIARNLRAVHEHDV